MVRSYDKFVISDFVFDEKTAVASFFYGFDGEGDLFCETIDFSSCFDDEYDSLVLRGLLFHLHIALGVSYYKLFPTKTIELHSGSLDEKQKVFWQDFYTQGLGEFFFRNDIDPSGLAVFDVGSKVVYEKNSFELGKSWLVPLGGGKDSLVTVELLREYGQDFSLFSFGYDSVLHKSVADVVGKERIVVKRILSESMFSMVKDGYYNGHVPITGIVYFVSLVVCYFQKFQGVIFSNERSADFGNTVWKGMTINHQRSKSQMFEESLQSYVSGYIHPEFVCASALRQWTELRIVKEFSRYRQYFEVFSSCNRNFHLEGSRIDNNRCGKCPKCVSTYILLRPFVGGEDVAKIWGEELYEQESLLEDFKDLRGVGGIKPFECVGEAEEYQYATWKLLADGSMKNKSVILSFFEDTIGSKKTENDWKELGKKELADYEESLLLPFLKQK